MGEIEQFRLETHPQEDVFWEALRLEVEGYKRRIVEIGKDGAGYSSFYDITANLLSTSDATFHPTLGAGFKTPKMKEKIRADLDHLGTYLDLVEQNQELREQELTRGLGDTDIRERASKIDPGNISKYYVEELEQEYTKQSLDTHE